MEENLDQEIKQMATRVRRADFLWTAGVVSLACALLMFLAKSVVLPIIAVWLITMAGLAVRFWTVNVNWSQPVARAVRTQMALYQRLTTVLNALPEPVILLQGDGIVELANPAAAAFIGTPPAGQHLTSVFRAPVVAAALEDAVKSGQPQMADFIISGSVRRHCRVYVTPLYTAVGGEQDEEIKEERVVIFISDLSDERRLEKMRTDFIANASHELRTPLASMLGFIETLRGHARDDAQAREKFLGIMQSQAERMLRLVRDLMSLSSIELNEHMPPDDTIDPVLLAEDIRASMSPVAESYQGMIRVDNRLGGERVPVIAGDRDELVQVLQNLTDNALKYGGTPPEVSIVIGRGEPEPPGSGGLRAGETAAQISTRAGLKPEDLVYIQIRDKGQGIARKDLPRLTERFYRADVEKSKARGGTGLGLAIVKHIVNRHKGGLQIESSEGHGAAFTCFFRPKIVGTDI